MSTFGGKIKEIPFISVDRFDGANLDSLAYFLSHCHTDHMVGLTYLGFHEKISKNNQFLYASPVSCVILKRLCPNISNQIRELTVGIPTSIFFNGKSISVTTIPAGHCPGSVMFLFEGDSRILYTGDYRINPNDMYKITCFYDSFQNVKVIDKIYLDTTFFLKTYMRFPKRSESLEELIRLIQEWITKSNRHIIKLNTSAKYGYEFLFNEIYKKIKMPVHVNDEIFKIYSLIPELDNAVTNENSPSQIHCSCGISYTHICKSMFDYEVRVIRISALRWQQDELQNGLSDVSESGIHRLCYSTHASYEEGVKLLEFLKPIDIEACVEQEDPYNNKLMMKFLQETLTEIKNKNIEDTKVQKIFEVSENVKDELSDSTSLTSSQSSTTSICDIFGSPPNKIFIRDILDSPPR